MLETLCRVPIQEPAIKHQFKLKIICSFRRSVRKFSFFLSQWRTTLIILHKSIKFMYSTATNTESKCYENERLDHNASISPARAFLRTQVALNQGAPRQLIHRSRPQIRHRRRRRSNRHGRLFLCFSSLGHGCNISLWSCTSLAPENKLAAAATL